MAANVGTLLINLEANVARLQSDMERSRRVVEDAMGRMSAGVDAFKSRLLGAMTVGAFTALIKGTIDAADHLGKLSQRTGLTVETLAGLKHAADLSDVSFEGLAGSLKKLAIFQVEATTGSKENAAWLRALGVTARDPKDALMQIADTFAAMPDGVEKSAAAVKLLGKSGDEMIPLLNGGSAALRAMIEEGQRLNPITDEMAGNAETFNDNMTRLSAGVAGAGASIANVMLPAFVDISQAFVDSSGNGKKSADMFVIVGEAARIAASGVGTVKFLLQDAGDALGAYAAQLAALVRGDMASIATIQKERAAQSASAMQDYMALEKKITEHSIFFGDGVAQAAPSVKKATTDTALHIIKALGDTKTEQDKLSESIANQIRNLELQALFFGISAEQVKVYELAMKGATKAQVEEAQGWVDRLNMLKQLAEDAKGELGDGDAGKKLISQAGELDPMKQEELRYQEQRNLAEVYRQAGLGDYEQYTAIREMTEQQHRDKLKQLALDGFMTSAQFAKLDAVTQTQIVLQKQGSIIGAAAQHSRAMFNMQKAVALAQAAIALPETVMDAYKWGTKYGGPILGAAFATTAAAAQLININAIKSSQFGGDMASTPSAGGIGAGAIPGGTANTQAIPAISPSTGAPRNVVDVTISLGSQDGLLPVSAVRSLIDQINEQIRDGATIEQIRVS